MLTKYYNNHSRFKIRSIKGFVKMRGLTKKTHTQKKKIGDGNSTNNHWEMHWAKGLGWQSHHDQI